MAFDLKNKVVFLTGGSIGIGAATARLFLEEGVKHIAVTDVNEEDGKKLEEELNSKYASKAQFIKCDVTNEDELFAAYKKVLDAHGYIDIVVNNAGIMNDSPAVYKKAIEVNVTALITSTYKAREFMRKDRSGRGGVIINISSIAGLMQSPYMPIYFATKSAVLQFSNCLGSPSEYEKTGVKIITMCFGGTNTSLLSKEKLKPYDDDMNEENFKYITTYSQQSAEAAAKGLIEACKRGESGSTWLSKRNQPVEDITSTVKKAYDILTEVVHN